MDDPKKKEVKDKFLREGGDPRWITGNVGADNMPNQGASLVAPPKHLLVKEQLRLTTARTFQRMAVHMIAIARGYVAAEKADGHEAEWDDAHLGLDDSDAGNWEIGIEDVLMDEVMFAEAYAGGHDHPAEHDDAMGFCSFDDPDETWNSNCHPTAMHQPATNITTNDDATTTHAPLNHPTHPTPQQQPQLPTTHQPMQQQPRPADPPAETDVLEQNGGSNEVLQQNTSATLAKARKNFQGGKRFYPTRAKGDAGLMVDVSAFSHDVHRHERLRCKAVSNGGMGKNKVLT